MVLLSARRRRFLSGVLFYLCLTEVPLGCLILPLPYRGLWISALVPLLVHKTLCQSVYSSAPVDLAELWIELDTNSQLIQYNKEKEIWLSPMTKAPTPTEQSKKQRDNTQTPPKTSITQRLRTDLRRSVGVTIATKLVWLNRFTGSQPSH